MGCLVLLATFIHKLCGVILLKLIAVALQFVNIFATRLDRLALNLVRKLFYLYRLTNGWKKLVGI